MEDILNTGDDGLLSNSCTFEIRTSKKIDLKCLATRFDVITQIILRSDYHNELTVSFLYREKSFNMISGIGNVIILPVKVPVRFINSHLFHVEVKQIISNAPNFPILTFEGFRYYNRNNSFVDRNILSRSLYRVDFHMTREIIKEFNRGQTNWFMYIFEGDIYFASGSF